MKQKYETRISELEEDILELEELNRIQCFVSDQKFSERRCVNSQTETAINTGRDRKEANRQLAKARFPSEVTFFELVDANIKQAQASAREHFGARAKQVPELSVSLYLTLIF